MFISITDLWLIRIVIHKHCIAIVSTPVNCYAIIRHNKPDSYFKDSSLATRVKIKIDDIPELREKIDTLYTNKTQIQLARWAIQLAKHIFISLDYDYITDRIISAGFSANENWQRGKTRNHDVRQAGFEIHRLAKHINDKGLQTAFRVAGQAVGTGHMKEHAMVASDYAIRVINIQFPNNQEAVRRERQWQIDILVNC